MKIAITGSEGFIGAQLAQALGKEGHKVIACTKENCDIKDTQSVKNALKGAEVVVHCAAQLDEEAGDLWEVNVSGTENVLHACEENNAEHFIFLSSAGVYGMLHGKKDEQTEPGPETAYEKSKLEAEKIALSFQEVFGITILRPALVLGSNNYWKGIINTIRKGYPLIGEGRNSWQMVCDNDLVRAISFCMNMQETFGEIFIVAEKEALTLEEVVGTIRDGLGMPGKAAKIPLWAGMLLAHMNSIINFDPILKPPYVKRMQAERDYSTKKLEALGWRAKCSSKEYLPRIVEKSR